MDDVTKFKGFACQCGEKARKEMDDLRALAIERKQVGPDPVWFTTAAILQLNQAYDMDLTWLATDQWGGMVWKTNTEDKDPFNVRVEFDLFEDGLAMVLDACFKKWGKWREHNEEDEEQ